MAKVLNHTHALVATPDDPWLLGDPATADWSLFRIVEQLAGITYPFPAEFNRDREWADLLAAYNPANPIVVFDTELVAEHPDATAALAELHALHDTLLALPQTNPNGTPTTPDYAQNYACPRASAGLVSWSFCHYRGITVAVVNDHIGLPPLVYCMQADVATLLAE